jgi:hypothetical protein
VNTQTPEERQSFFDEKGYWPCDPVIVRISKPRFTPRGGSSAVNSAALQLSLRGRFLRGWRAPLHWLEPPLFEKPGLMYEELGHEEFSRQVEEYYASIRDAHCSSVFRAHTKWAIRQILRNFETHVRGFRGQSVSARGGRITNYSKGQEKWGREHAPKYQDILTMPEDIGKEEGRLVNEIEAHLRAYAVPEMEIAASAAEVRAKLERIWGIKL